jgi:hypothetical protein
MLSITNNKRTPSFSIKVFYTVGTLPNVFPKKPTNQPWRAAECTKCLFESVKRTTKYAKKNKLHEPIWHYV